MMKAPLSFSLGGAFHPNRAESAREGARRLYTGGPLARRTNYGFEKQQREQRKKKKKEEKAERRRLEEEEAKTPDGTEATDETPSESEPPDND